MLDAYEMITFTEKLIEEIKHFPVLYDRKVMMAKDKLEKEEAWISLTDRLPTNLGIKGVWLILNTKYNCNILHSNSSKNYFCS